MFPCVPFSDIQALGHEFPNFYFSAIVNDLHLYFVFGHIANKFNVILSILKEVIILPEPEKGDLFRINKYEYPTTKIRFLSFVEFPYEGKKLAAYAEKRVCTIYLHMETLAKSWS